MSRARAVEWLFWHHKRERWETICFKPVELREYYRMFVSRQPRPDNLWTKWVLG